MPKLLIAITLLAVGAFLVSNVVTAAPFQGGKAQEKAAVLQSEWVEEIFIDYHYDPSHAGPGPHPTAESDSFHLTQGGIRWFSTSTSAFSTSTVIEYRITGAAPTSTANTAIEDAEETWDGFIATRSFARDDADPTPLNPCTATSSRVIWTSIDGSGGALATASVCRNVATKEIAGFVVKLDIAESWTANGTSTTEFDVQNVASHEFGHVAGLGHVNAPKDGCLAMYKFAIEGETQKRTLGLGDKLGMDELYATSDTSAGPGCGL